MNKLLGKHNYFTLFTKDGATLSLEEGVKVPTISTGIFCVTLSED